MKIPHTTLLIVALAFVNAQAFLASMYYLNDGKICLTPQDYTDGAPVLLLDCERVSESWAWPDFVQGYIRTGNNFTSCLTVNYNDGEALQIWGCGQNRDQTFDIFYNHTIGLSSHPGQCLGVPTQWNVRDPAVISACGSDQFGYTGFRDS